MVCQQMVCVAQPPLGVFALVGERKRKLCGSWEHEGRRKDASGKCSVSSRKSNQKGNNP